MTERTVPGGEAYHADAYAPDLNQAGVDESSKVDLTYRHNPPVGDYGIVAQRGRDVELKHPVTDIDELYHEAHLSVQLGEMHQAITRTEAHEDSPSASSGSGLEFDMAILLVAERALQAENVTLNGSAEASACTELPGNPARILALLLHDARAMASYPQLAGYLKETDETAQLLGLQSIPDQSTFWRTHNTLCEAGVREAVEHAATRAVHAVVRSGVVAPERVLAAHGLGYSSVVNEREIAPGTRRAAIRNWVASLLKELLEPISFGRAENSRHAIEAIIAAVAQGAYAHGLNSSRPTAGWYYDMTEVPSASQVSRLLRSVEPQQILRMFTDINRRFIHIASENGFFDRDYNFALDTTWVTYDGKQAGTNEELKLIENPKHGPGWLFAALCVMDVDARFALGLDLVEDKSETTEQFRFLLRTAAQEGGVKRIHIDREFYDGDAVRMCRAIAGQNWVIRAKRQGEAAALLAETPAGESNSRTDIDFADVTPGPNLVVYPIPEEYRDDSSTTHLAFLTDLDPDEIDIGDVARTYLKRWSVETHIRQLKHDVGVKTSSPSRDMRVFLLQIAALCYNIHTLLNRATDPTYALRLNVPYYEVLLAIVDVVYTRSSATDRPS